MLIVAIALISAALVLYTAGVWAEHRAGSLQRGHAVLFGLGLAADASGTWVMSALAAASDPVAGGLAGTLNAVMASTGALALGLMALHLTWALVVLLRNRAGEKGAFHRLSVGVWALWLVPYVTGMAASMV